MEKKKGIIVASFGTTYEHTRKLCIGSIEDLVRERYEDYEVLRAFTSEKIRSILKNRDKINIYNVTEALERMKELEIKEISIQPLLMIPGHEYEKIVKQVEIFKKENEAYSVKVSKPLLYEEDDYYKVIDALLDDGVFEDRPIVFMGHGTDHNCDRIYQDIEKLLVEKGYEDVFIGTVEGSKTLNDIIIKLKKRSVKNLVLRPFMLVAGDHAINDMASEDENSWFSQLSNNGINAEVKIIGLGELNSIKEIFLGHLSNQIKGS